MKGILVTCYFMISAMACAKISDQSMNNNSQSELRSIAQQKTLTKQEFKKRTGFVDGEYYDSKDNENCLGGEAQLLLSKEGLLTLKMGDKILVSGIGLEEVMSDDSERDCKIINTTKIIDSKIYATLEANCTSGLNKKITTVISFLTDPKTRKPIINYTQKREVPKQKDNFLTCNLVGA